MSRPSTRNDIEMISQILATLACGIFAGAAIYVSFVEQPARLSCGSALAVREWRSSYKRGSRMQASLAVLSSVLAFFSWWMRDKHRLVDRGPTSVCRGSLYADLGFPNQPEASE